MDAAPALVEIADALASAKLEAILIGNARAALHGAPVTTVDFDFFYRTSKADPQAKIRQVAANLHTDASRPFRSLSSVYRLRRQNPSCRWSPRAFMAQSILTAWGAGVLRLRSKDEPFWSPPSLISFKVRKKRIVPTIVPFSMSLSEPLLNKPKRARKPTKRDIKLKAMRHVWQHHPVDVIRARLALPMHQRTHFLCKRLANGGSTL